MAKSPVDAYLSRAPPDHRAALERLRRQIHRAAPGATEKLSYGIPTFVLDGRNLVHFASFRAHCTFFPGSIVQELGVAKLLGGFAVSKGGVRFTPDRPLPATTVARIVKARIAQNRARYGEPRAVKKTVARGRARARAREPRPPRRAPARRSAARGRPSRR